MDWGFGCVGFLGVFCVVCCLLFVGDGEVEVEKGRGLGKIGDFFEGIFNSMLISHVSLIVLDCVF